MCFASPCLLFLSGYSQLYRFSDLVESEVEKKHGLLYPETVRAVEPAAREVTMTSEKSAVIANTCIIRLKLLAVGGNIINF